MVFIFPAQPNDMSYDTNIFRHQEGPGLSLGGGSSAGLWRPQQHSGGQQGEEEEAASSIILNS